MPKIFANFSTAALTDMIDANLIKKSLSFAHFFEGEIHGPDPLWYKTGKRMPNNNGVVSGTFDKHNIDKRIQALVQPFKSRKRPLTWWIGPRTTPDNLGQSLQKHGFVHNRDMIGMAADLDTLALPDSAPRLDLQPVHNIKILRGWYNVIIKCFPTSYSQSYFDALAAISLRPGADWLHYVGRVDGKIVSASSLFLGTGVPADGNMAEDGDVAGLYNLGTLPQARRRGYGALTTLKCFHIARERGYRVGTLQTTYPNALRMYHQMGFEVYCKIGIYRYIPKEMANG